MEQISCCIISRAPIVADYIRAEALAGRMGAAFDEHRRGRRSRGRIYLSPTQESEDVARSGRLPCWKPEIEFFQQALGFRVGNYGMSKWCDLFTPRQLVALTTLSDLGVETRARILQDALAAGMPDDAKGLEAGGTSATAYAEAVSVYLAFAVDRCADFSNSVTRWVPGNQKVMNLFGQMFSDRFP